jgi:hypothetical protein
MAGTICVYIRDEKHPADLWDSDTHNWAIRIREIGSLGPLYWQNQNYDWLQLPYKGEFGKVAGEYIVPAGTYLLRGYAYG